MPWTCGSLVLILGALALVFLTGNRSIEIAIIQEGFGADITHGPPRAAVQLVEYADFQCPACASYSSILASLRTEYKGDVLFVFRFFPLRNHRFAMASAQAAYAAFLQGHFWEMHDMLYEKQEEWSNSDDPYSYFASYAIRLELDISKFSDDFSAQSTIDFITRQKAVAQSVGVDHTPTFVLNGAAVAPRDYDEFHDLIEVLP